MKRLIVVVEGQTEDEFVRNVLRPHLAVFGVFASSTIVGLDRIRKLCPRFGAWLHFLEQLAQETTE